MNVNQTRAWILTLKADDYTADEVCDRLKKYTWAGQLEEGEGGFRHYQILIEHSSPIQFRTLKNKFPTGHFEARQGSVAQALAYVTKEETRVEALPGNGVIDTADEKGKRTDLERLREQVALGVSVNELIIASPATARYSKHLKELETAIHLERAKAEGEHIVEVEYWWGDTGAGKTKTLRNTYGYRDVYVVTDYDRDPFGLYSGESVLVLEEYHSDFPIRQFLKMCDPEYFQFSRRFVNGVGLWNKIIVISNKAPEEQYERIAMENPRTHEAFLGRFNLVRGFFWDNGKRVQTSYVPEEYTRRNAA